MAAQNTDLLLKVASNTGWQLDASGISDSSVTSFGLINATSLPTDTAVIVTVDRVDSSGNKTPDKMERIIGVVSGNNITSCIRSVEGTAQAHAGGAVVEIVISESNINKLMEHLLIEHNQDGTHKSGANIVSEAGTQTLTNKTLSSGVKLDSNADNNITEYGMSRQAIMNGNFDLWQRGTSVALADVTVKFQADRWRDYVDKNGGTLPTLTRSRQELVSGDIPNAKYYTRLTTNGAGTSLGVDSNGALRQPIEHGTSKLCGLNKKVTISFWAKSDIVNKRICPTLLQNYGTGGSPSTQEAIHGTPITLTSTWTKYTATFTTNTLVGKTFGTNNDDILKFDFYYMWGTTYGNTYVQTGVTAETFVGAGNIDIAQVQLCAGDVALPFNPKSFEEELRACQRYYEKNQWMASRSSGSTFFGGTVFYKVSKRTSITPTFTDTVGNISKVSIDSSNNVSISNGGIVSTTTEKFEFDSIISIGTGNWSRIIWTADAEL